LAVLSLRAADDLPALKIVDFGLTASPRISAVVRRLHRADGMKITSNSRFRLLFPSLDRGALYKILRAG
jgi:hypothetical protein